MKNPYVKAVFDFARLHYQVILILLILVGAFYWFEVRPANIRMNCEAYIHDFGVAHPDATTTEYNFQYSTCLHKYGL